MPLLASHRDPLLPRVIYMDAPDIRDEALVAHEGQLSRQSDWVSTMTTEIQNIGSDSRVHFSTAWVETLLDAPNSRPNFDWRTGVIFFCVDCHNGMYRSSEFQGGGLHSGHEHFPMFSLSNTIVIHMVVLMSLDLDVSDIHFISHCGHYYRYLHTPSRKMLDARKEDPMQYECAYCEAPFSGPFRDDRIKYCSLQCKYLSIMGMGDAVSPRPKSRSPPPEPVYEFTFGQFTSRFTASGGSSGLTKATKDSPPRDSRHSGTSASGDSGVQQSIGGHEGPGGCEHESNASLQSSISGASTTTHSSSRPQSESNFDACHGRDITGTLTYDQLTVSHCDGLCKPCSNLQLHADRKDAAESRTSTPNSADFDAIFPEDESLLVQKLEREPEKCLRVDPESGATMIVPTGMEEPGDKPVRSNDGVLKKAFALFRSYIVANPPDTQNSAGFDAIFPAEESLLVQKLEVEPENCLSAGPESGATMILLTETEEPTEKPATLNDGILKKALALFQSYIAENPPVPLEESFVGQYSESDEDVANAFGSDLEMDDVDEVPASELKVNGDDLDLWARLLLTMSVSPSGKLPLPLGKNDEILAYGDEPDYSLDEAVAIWLAPAHGADVLAAC